jgi:hypothetical protein
MGATCPSTLDWKAEYWPNRNLTGPSSLCRSEGLPNNNWGNGSPDIARVPADDFSARYSKTINVAGGNVTFKVGSDDGYRLIVDGNVIGECWCDQEYKTKSFVVPLTAGPHLVQVEYYERMGLARVTLTITPPA